ncbi:dihydropteroate synthase [Candidatus Formimonas warabiya]|uniref:Pterin-binding domain-containing protein n=1 Tax=Formimonas warabiya TaxID=1761012 RepID=A0A3G1KZU1_FORW1|nr:dihydropteroate synthase [Candidatus Formimonas warabiya]ATW28053.1 hypothetical protein DCMF_27825 [Candidatus Formimonas warabiya]
MLLIGESINGTIPEVGAAILAHDERYLLELAKVQIDSGANMLDINAGVAGGNEEENLSWIVELIQSQYRVPLMLDSDDPAVLKKAFTVLRDPEKAIINSVNGDEYKLNVILPLVAENKCSVVALCLNEKGIPHDVPGRIAIGNMIVNKVKEYEIPVEKIYLDPLVFSMSTAYTAAMTTINTLLKIKETFSGIKTVCGLSNVSHGLPVRKLINRTFLIMNLVCGMDAFIVDVRDRELMASAIAGKALVGQDERCKEYITAFRKGKLK